MSQRIRFDLLSSNAKLAKQNGVKYLIAGLALAPHMRSGYNVCESAGFCASLCVLWMAGRTVTQGVRDAMIRRTKMFFEDRQRFDSLLFGDIEKLCAVAERAGLIPLCRPNVGSDLDWTHLAERFPSCGFYDYTKIRSRALAMRHGDLPPNYEVTYSVNELAHGNFINAQLEYGCNVAVVTSTRYCGAHHQFGRLPKQWRDVDTADGDRHDIRLRAMDGRGKAILLRYKGAKRLKQPGIDRGFIWQAPDLGVYTPSQAARLFPRGK